MSICVQLSLTEGLSWGEQNFFPILYLGDMRNSQDKADRAHTQGQQLFSLKETRKVGAQLIFNERYDDLHIGELWDTEVWSCVNGDKAIAVYFV